MKSISKEQLLENKGQRMTMADLREFVHKNPQIDGEAPVMIQRIEDVYFEDRNWKVLLKEGYWHFSIMDTNEKMLKEIQERKEGRNNYPNLKNPEKYIVELTDELKEQFFSAWCISKEKDDSIVYIYNHY